MTPFYQYLFLGIIQLIFLHGAIHDNVEVHCCVIAMKGKLIILNRRINFNKTQNVLHDH